MSVAFGAADRSPSLLGQVGGVATAVRDVASRPTSPDVSPAHSSWLLMTSWCQGQAWTNSPGRCTALRRRLKTSTGISPVLPTTHGKSGWHWIGSWTTPARWPGFGWSHALQVARSRREPSAAALLANSDRYFTERGLSAADRQETHVFHPFHPITPTKARGKASHWVGAPRQTVQASRSSNNWHTGVGTAFLAPARTTAP